MKDSPAKSSYRRLWALSQVSVEAHRSNFLFLMAGVDSHGCYGRATRVISETDFARKFATLVVLPPFNYSMSDWTTALPDYIRVGNNRRTKTGRETDLGGPENKRSSRKTTWRLTAQGKIKRPVADKERLNGDSESGLAQHVQDRPKKKRRSGDAAALGLTKSSVARRAGVVSRRWPRAVRPAVDLPRQ